MRFNEYATLNGKPLQDDREDCEVKLGTKLHDFAKNKTYELIRPHRHGLALMDNVTKYVVAEIEIEDAEITIDSLMRLAEKIAGEEENYSYEAFLEEWGVAEWEN